MKDITVFEKLKLETPYALTFDGWNEWQKKTKAERPYAYFINYTLRNYYSDFIYIITTPYTNTRFWIHNHITERPHIIDTGLPPGYHDMCEKMLHGNFNMLVDFVEIEKAWLNVVWQKDSKYRKKYPWWSLNPTRFKRFRCPEAGIDYLNYDCESRGDRQPFNKPTEQSLAAKEILELYNWWKNIHPKRPDPMVSSGWSELCSKIKDKGRNVLFDKHTKEDEDELEKRSDLLNKIEKDYTDEDQDMLVRLMKVRQNLWS